MEAIVKELHTDLRKKLKVEEIVQFGKGRKRGTVVLNKFLPTSTTDFKKRTYYGRIKEDNDGKKYVYKLWILLLGGKFT